MSTTEKESKSFTHTFKPKKKKNFFFLNILKIFHITMEVYGKIFKVECTNYKPNAIQADLNHLITFQLKIRKKE